MKGNFYKIDDPIFDQFPSFCRAVLLCRGIDNRIDSNIDFSVLRSMMSVTLESLTTSASIAAWRKAFREMHIDPTRERVSFEALSRRLLNGKPPKSINQLVDLGNYFSILYQCPVGIHPMGELTEDIRLRPAVGDERFQALDRDTPESPEPGEIILTSGDLVLTRRFCWRQSRQSLVTSDCSDLFVNIDFMSPVVAQHIEDILDAFRSCISEFSPRTQYSSFTLNYRTRTARIQI